MERRTSGRVSAFRRTPLFAAIACAFAQGALAGNFTVTNSNDFGAGSLRKAIDDANFDCTEMDITSSTITFVGASFTGPFAIKPSQPLPPFQCAGRAEPYNVNIDATVAYGAAPNTDPNGFNAVFGVTLDGSRNFYGGTCGLEYIDNGYGGALGVTGMEIINFNYGASGYGLCGRLNAFGNRLANNGNGMRLVDGSQIGNGYPANRNVIIDSAAYAAYGGWGIEIGAGTYYIYNNFIGTSDGKTAAPNDEGIVWDCCNRVGGSIQGNVIVSTGYANIDLGADSFYISNNKIGTDVSGTAMLGSASYGIALYYSYGSTISDNVISGAGSNGVDVYNSSGVWIGANKIGTTADGSAAMPNDIGIYDQNSTNTTIFGNEISGNNSYGIWLSGTTNASVNDNFIGTNYGGTLAVPNQIGVYLGQSPSGSFRNNTISGNYGTGFLSSGASNVSISNNFIGTTTGGGKALSNQGYGIEAKCGTGLSVAGNNVSYNYSGGIRLSAVQASNFSANAVNSNGRIEGTSATGIYLSSVNCGITGKFALAKAGKKAKSPGSAKGILAGSVNYSDGNTFYGNTIASNTQDGVLIQDGSHNGFSSNDVHSNAGDGIRVSSGSAPLGSANRISMGSNYGNGSKNIDLASPSANNGQPRPVINRSSVVRNTSAGTTSVTVEVTTTTAGEYIFELFKNSSSAIPAGEIFLMQSGDLNQASAGLLTYTFTVPDITSDNFSATVTHVDTGDTSEFADIASALALPAVNILPTSIDFGDVVVGRQSPQGAITITSQGGAPYVISQLRDSSCTGPTICSSGAFVCSTSCVEGSPYSNNTSCTITASFAPTALGPQSKTLALCDNATGSPRTLSLAGNAITAPAVDIAISPTFTNFGEVLVGAQSAPKDFTLTNMGTSQVYLGNVKIGPDFTISGNTCGSTLSAGAACNTDVVFAPLAKGLVFEALEVTASDTPIAAALRKRAKASAPPITKTVSATLQGSGIQTGDLRLPASIPFGTLLLHAAPARQTVTIANTGNGTLTLGKMSVTGPFTLGNPCPATLAPGASCVLTLDFNPLTLGTFNGTLSVVTDAPGGTRFIPLSAQVTADPHPVVRVSPTIVGFGNRVIGTQSPASRVTISNEGAQTAVLGPITLVQPQPNATEFSVSSTNCTATLEPQATCFADVIMKPLGFGGRQGQMIVPSNSADSPQTVTLGGTGCKPFASGANRSARDPCAP